MSVLVDSLAAFHFLRPLWLLLVPAILLLWLRVRRSAGAAGRPPREIAPHLAAALTVGGDSARRFLPIDGVALALLLASLGAAGPTWSRAINPLAAQTAPLAIALQVSESMLDPDIAPNRLERAKHKIRDVIEARTGARTALVAYAGTAHLVAPLTEDPEVLKPFLEALDPAIMPVPGRNATEALALAIAALAPEPVPGAILFVADGLDAADLGAFADNAATESPLPVVALNLGGAAGARELTQAGGVAVVDLTPDGADVTEIERRVASAWRAALAGDDAMDWEDRGWWLAWPAALLTLLWFRRGWTMRWALLMAAGLAAAPGGRAEAGVIDWFLTPDQQGRLAYERKDFDAAAELFQDPLWRGQALYRDGQYEAAAEVFARLPSSEAAFAEGMAQIRNRGYRPAIAAFEKALERDPDNAAAARNLEIARVILDYVEDAREASDTGEETGIGADDVVFDNEENRGAEMKTPPEESAAIGAQTAEQWMRSVVTQTDDFLRQRFALEAAR